MRAVGSRTGSPGDGQAKSNGFHTRGLPRRYPRASYQRTIPPGPTAKAQPVTASYSDRNAPTRESRAPKPQRGALADVPATARRPQPETGDSVFRPQRSTRLPSEWFHVLLNSLFKVLFNFPSRYLFAVGLTFIFSLRWSFPPA